MKSSAPPPILELTNASKTFGGRMVLKAAQLTLFRGEVHGLIGQNGSGKSTLIKILAGYHAPDRGARLKVRQTEVPLPLRPDDPNRLGISFVHQDLGLIDTASVLENLRIGRFELGFGRRIRWRSERRQATRDLARFDMAVDPDTPVGRLPEVERAMLAILRASDRIGHVPGSILVLDEPTAYLPYDGVQRLFDVVRQITTEGSAVLFVSHRLEEVIEVTDRLTVLRDGGVVATELTARTSEDGLIRHVVGSSLEALYPPRERGHRTDSALAARNVRGAGVRKLSFDVGKGEIVGLTGLLGMGWEMVPYLLFGATPSAEGTLHLGGQVVALKEMSPREAVNLGLALIPANRLRDGAVGTASVQENLTLRILHEFFHYGVLKPDRERHRAAALTSAFNIVPLDPRNSFEILSGGNQQKTILAKWFATKPAVFLMHEPTQGVDVSTRRQIFEQIRGAAREGSGVVLASSEYEDLAHLCDRVLVLRRGQVAATLTGNELTEERIIEQSYRSD